MIKIARQLAVEQSTPNRRMPWQTFKMIKPNHKSIFMACAILVYTHWEPGRFFEVRVLLWDSHCAIYFKRIWHLWRYPSAGNVIFWPKTKKLNLVIRLHHLTRFMGKWCHPRFLLFIVIFIQTGRGSSMSLDLDEKVRYSGIRATRDV